MKKTEKKDKINGRKVEKNTRHLLHFDWCVERQGVALQANVCAHVSCNIKMFMLDNAGCSKIVVMKEIGEKKFSQSLCFRFDFGSKASKNYSTFYKSYF